MSPALAYEDAVRQLITVSASQTLAATNREKYELIKDGVTVTFKNRPRGVLTLRKTPVELSAVVTAVLCSRWKLPPDKL